MADPYADFSDVQETKIDPAVQRKRDLDGLAIVKSETPTAASAADKKANAREIATRQAALDKSDPYAAFSTPLNVGSGRGLVNPPLVGQPQPSQPAAETPDPPVYDPGSGVLLSGTPDAPSSNPMSYGDQMRHVGGQLITAARATPAALDAAAAGVSHGATMGLDNYAIAGTDALTTPRLKFSDALARVRARNAQVQTDNPIAYTGGNVAGNVALGAATGGGGITANAAKQATMGAVEGYTQNGDINDAKKGALVGTITGTVGGLLGKTINSLSNKELQAMADQMTAAHAAAHEAGIANEALHYTPEAVKQMIQQGDWSVMPFLTTQARQLMQTAKDTATGVIAPAIGGGAAGAVAGAGTALASGTDPVKGAMYGAGAGAGASLIHAKTKAVSQMAGQVGEGVGGLNLAFPSITSKAIPAATTLATSAAVPVVTANTNGTQDPYASFSDLSQP